MKPAPFELHACRSLPEAIALLAAGDGMAKAAGGTQSLGPMLNLRLAQPAQLIDVSRVEALRGFALQGEILRIGAGVTHARIEDGQLPEITRGLLPAVAGGIAYRAVRNRGTLGGSLAHADPAADWVSTMTLLDATLVLLGPAGERSLRASAFFLGPFTTALRDDELLVAIEIGRFSPRARWAYRKACRKPGEFAEAIAAVWTDSVHGIARVVLGALGGMPHVIEGQGALEQLRTDAGLERALDDAGLAEPYERQLHATMLRRALADLDASE
jgi:carbon-monoxide dehydrogenase medium subunit